MKKFKSISGGIEVQAIGCLEAFDKGLLERHSISSMSKAGSIWKSYRSAKGIVNISSNVVVPFIDSKNGFLVPNPEDIIMRYNDTLYIVNKDIFEETFEEMREVENGTE